MKGRRKIFWALVLSFALIVGMGVGFIPAPAPAQAAGSSFTDLNQEQITEAMGAGWNLGNQLEASSGGIPNETAWSGVEVSESLIRSVKANGFSSIRIPVSWLGKIGAAPNYTIDQTWVNRIKTIVDWAIKYHLYVVINMHGDGYKSVQGGWLLPDAEDQDTIKKKYEIVWGQIAEAFKDYDEHLIFESMNEIGANLVNDKDESATTKAVRSVYGNINDYNQIFVDTVRKTGGNNAKRWLLIPGFNTNIDYTAGNYGFQIPEDNNRSADIPEEEKRIMISVHYYNPWDFCGQEDYHVTQWGEEADASRTAGYGTEKDMEDSFAKLKRVFTSKGYPVVIGEYGAIDKTTKDNSGKDADGNVDLENNSFRAYFAWKVCTESKKNGCIPVYWDNGWSGDFGYSLISRGTEQDKKKGFRSAGKVMQPEIVTAIVGCFGGQSGTATAVSLDKQTITMDLTDAGQQLTAEMTPGDAKDTITWESSDESVARVSYRGKVTPKGVGTCLVTATVPNGPSAYCIVKVTEPRSFKAGLYAQINGWSTLSGKDYLEIGENGTGKYTLTLTGAKSNFQPLYSLYIKDVTAFKGIAGQTMLKSADITIDSIKFNGHSHTLKRNTFTYDRAKQEELDENGMVQSFGSSDGAFDFAILNAWAESKCYISDMVVGSNAGTTAFTFPSSEYLDEENTVTIELTISNAVVEIPEGKEEIPVSDITADDGVAAVVGQSVSASAVAAPADATEKLLWFSENPRVASVDQNGVVTGVKQGETVLHVLTMSGKDVKIPVKVTLSPEATEEPTLPPLDSPEPTEDSVVTEPPTESSNAPTTDQPSVNETSEPVNTVEPGAPSTEPPAGSSDPSGSSAPSTTNLPASDSTAAPSGTPNGNASDGNTTVTPSAVPTQTPSGNDGKGDTERKKVTVKKVTLQKVKSAKKKTITVSWKKLSGVTGYQIVVGLDKKMKKGKKTVTIKKAKTVKTTVKKLKSKKKYFVKIRAYKTVKGKKHYGSWSKVKTVKVK